MEKDYKDLHAALTAIGFRNNISKHNLLSCCRVQQKSKKV